jgi:DNA ligase-1
VKRFANLYAELDETTKTSEKIAALISYFREAPAVDAAWAVYLLGGRKIPQLIPTRRMCQWAAEAARIPEWLFEECYHAVGDLAETMALILPQTSNDNDDPLSIWIEQRLIPLRAMSSEQQQTALDQAWQTLSTQQRFVMHKLITGAFRVGVSGRLVTRSLAELSGIPVEVIAHRMMGDWRPSGEFFEALLAADTGDAELGRPYPFFLAHPLAETIEQLGPLDQWQVEWKWDGIRAQLIRRAGQTFVWSRGEDLMNSRFPEVEEVATHLPDGTVLDGEILAWNDEGVMPFASLQKRIGRKNLTRRILDDVPVAFVAFDLIEHRGQDIRGFPLAKRRSLLEQVLQGLGSASIRCSPLVSGEDWARIAAIRETSRDHRTEGLMLKSKTSAYGVGRPRGDWWKWKIDPYTLDAVLVYAQPGSGRRASLFTDYTFALWKENQLVPFAKAYSGLTDAEIQEVDAFVRQNTIERFGPVRSVRPELVFELAFENIQRSTRHKSGIAVRFPRISRWRRDKRPQDADRLEIVLEWLP